jgi:8-oxo-dGTP pyrophosphatase MutT (NUDIX family)
VRPLGIATLAVHLVGQTTDGRYWVQQRALNKPNDPGQWDTLMGGMVSAEDTVDTALERETWEEAGLHPAELKSLRYGGRQSNCRPSSDGAAGYMQEFIEWYVATVPDGLMPVNQDGEVAQFVLMDAAQLLRAMEDGEFTTEASLIMASVLGLGA